MDYLNKYQYKIKNIQELKNIFKKNINKTTVLCHGVFDVVHPGHLRHLAHAKSKGDILIVSLTSDKYIKKGIYRPHIPENLRALNLAAFEMVDFVVIDRNEKANNILSNLKPNYYAKGFEYSSKGLPPATKSEMAVVKSYGGKMFFSPGDYVYSSSKFLENSLPDLSIEKLNVLFNKYNFNFNNIDSLFKNFKKLNVHIIGDTIIDTYTRTNFIGGQTKTPTFSLLKQKVDNYIGGAAIVAQHLKSAGANVTFTTVLGNDDLQKFTIKELLKQKIKVNPIIDPLRPTTNKNTIATGIYKLLKLDTLDNTPVNNDIQKKIAQNIKKTKADIVIFSDFRHGIFNKQSVSDYIKSIPKNAFKVADSQVASRWGNILEFKNFDLITPNEKEARFSLADQDSSIGSLAHLIKNKSKTKNLILKLGEKGVFCISNKKNNNYFSLDSFAKNLVDAVGAGDALLAYSTLSLFCTKSLAISAAIGSLAAACECEVDGNYPIKFEEVLQRANSVRKELKG